MHPRTSVMKMSVSVHLGEDTVLVWARRDREVSTRSGWRVCDPS